MNKTYWIIFCLVFGCSFLFAESPSIVITGTPPLPLENLIKNGDFEEGLKSWSISGELEKSAEEGWDVKLSDEAYKGKHSIYIKVEPKGREHSRGIWQSLSSLFPSGKIIPGKSYIISCFVKGKGVSNIGGDYCGAGISIGFWSSDWKKGVSTHARCGDTKDTWVKVISKPLECPEWVGASQCAVNVAYTSGEAWIDDVYMSEAYIEMSIKVSGSDILQVVVEDDTGKNIFDSGKLPDTTKEFSKILKVISVNKYKIKVVDKNGEIFEKEYPEISNK